MTNNEKRRYLNEISGSFSAIFSNIHNFKNATKTLTELGQKYYSEQKELMKNHDVDIINSNNISYYRLDTGLVSFLGHNKNSCDDMIRIVSEHLNKQYKWMLVEAYECFEDLIKRYFEFLSYIDRKILKEKEIEFLSENNGNTSFDEFRIKLANVIKKTVDLRDPEKLLNRIATYIPAIKDIEINNELNEHIRFKIMMISRFRHIIVHQRGRIRNYELFRSMLFKAAGVQMNSKDGETLQEVIDFYVYNDGTITMHEHNYMHEGMPLVFTNDRLSSQMRIMAAYGQFIGEQIMMKI